ncbi:MAG: single-stranded DNA-binding protein [Clostridium neonatale]
MNKIILMGRLVRDPELRHTENGDKLYTKFTIAVQRNFKLSDGSREADFIPVRVWGKKVEIVCKYVKKGNYITISGRLRTGSYEDNEGNKKYITEVVAEDFKFISGKREQTGTEDN